MFRVYAFRVSTLLQWVLIFNKKVSNGKLSLMLMLPFVFSLMGTLVGATAWKNKQPMNFGCCVCKCMSNVI
jgi:hypothetical protein